MSLNSYEEEGEFKVGAVLSQSPASFQVESPHGRRSKIKAANVVLSFERPSGAELLAEARRVRRRAWTPISCGNAARAAEFGFQDLARDYVGREPAPAESAGVLLKLHSAPMYFYRRGRGRFQAAPEETLKLALAGVEKKKRLQEQIAALGGAARALRVPARDRARCATSCSTPRTAPSRKPRRSSRPAPQTGLTRRALFERCGLLRRQPRLPPRAASCTSSSRRAPAFPAHEAPARWPRTCRSPRRRPSAWTTSAPPRSTTRSRSTRVSDDELRIGIHIAAPALAFAPGSALDAIARERLSTAYMPGRKFTMLPEDAIDALSLDEGGERPAVSLYLNVGAQDFALRGRHTKLERVRVARQPAPRRRTTR